MMRLSYWERKNIERLRDVIIIGAGLVGLSASIEIKRKRPDLNVVVIDQQIIGSAASSRNAGFACFGSVSEIVTDTQMYGRTEVAELVQKRKVGLTHMIDYFGPDKLGFVQSGGYELFYTKDEFEKWADHISDIHLQIGDSIFEICPTPKPLGTYRRSIFNAEEGQFDTGKLYHCVLQEAIKHDVEIIRGLRVINISHEQKSVKVEIQENQIDIAYKALVVASNALTAIFLSELDVTPVRNQVLITTPIPNHGIKGTFHLDRGYLYFRDVGDRILIGGGRNLFPDEETDKFGDNPANIEYLQSQIKRYILPNQSSIKVAQHWSGILSGGQNRLPIVKRLYENVIVAVRLGGMGVAMGFDIGIEAATMALESSL